MDNLHEIIELVNKNEVKHLLQVQRHKLQKKLTSFKMPKINEKENKI